MIISMHCQPICSRDFSSCTSSYLLVHPSCSSEVFSSYSHRYGNRISSFLTPRRRRRLEDPIVNYASNYYSTYPNGSMTNVSSSNSLTHRPIESQTDRKLLYCDLFNLLELPESSPSAAPVPPTTMTTTHSLKTRRRTHFNDVNNVRRHHHRLKDVENERKRSIHHKEKKSSDDIKEKSLKTNEIYSRRSSANHKGFFRRVMRQYFCVSASMANNGYSS